MINCFQRLLSISTCAATPRAHGLRGQHGVDSGVEYSDGQSDPTQNRPLFTCLDPRASTDSAIWYRRLKDQIVRWGFQYSLDTGEDLDKSDTPLYPGDVRLICRALALHGTAESCCKVGPGVYARHSLHVI